MLYKFLVKATERHLEETRPFITLLDDQLLHSKPLDDGRPLGEIVYHMLRSFEYYLRGITEGVWEPAPFAFDEFTTVDMLQTLWKEVYTRATTRLSLISLSDLSRVIGDFNRRATVGEILLEMLEHSIHHRGQLTVYQRLLDVEPAKIEYII
ncbi:MAG: DinB family protein [Candidatus Thorarchaeota archaeon]|jgi:uncharacterized damage-inducible protein DinB